MKIKIDAKAMRKLEKQATKNLNAAWLDEVRAVQASHGNRPKDEIKAELARRFSALFGGGKPTDEQLEGEAQNIIDSQAD